MINHTALMIALLPADSTVRRFALLHVYEPSARGMTRIAASERRNSADMLPIGTFGHMVIHTNVEG
ncbi:hypothetical protein [Cohnella caldifontis]|uniref:hypothetical protein n=1 Tax=Cohnella caldifontis TaxID=3027471 RepID=UPI0023ECA521|nr:hypothetical protein [Cohnella sp. YIM B05605]